MTGTTIVYFPRGTRYMDETMVADALRGAENVPQVQAVLAHLDYSIALAQGMAAHPENAGKSDHLNGQTYALLKLAQEMRDMLGLRQDDV